MGKTRAHKELNRAIREGRFAPPRGRRSRLLGRYDSPILPGLLLWLAHGAARSGKCPDKDFTKSKRS